MAFRQQAHMLALSIGLTPAANALGLKPERLRQWNKRYNWNVTAILIPTEEQNRATDPLPFAHSVQKETRSKAGSFVFRLVS